ncbi:MULTISPECIES: rhamnogalacturonan acetylesterase [Chitinophagaceae]
MKRNLSVSALLIVIVLTMAFISSQRVTIYMIGDSTMSVKQAKAYPETGWGMMFSAYFKESVTIRDLALNGRSTKSFRHDVDEKTGTVTDHWQPILDALKPGDYVFIEFGHNDEKINKSAVGTTISEFKSNLVQYVNETKTHRAFPILLTPIVRRVFKDGVLQDTHGAYADAVRQVADSLNVPLIDLQKSSSKLVQDLGETGAIQLYNYVDSGNINYPNGKKDDTHLNPNGADKIAALAADGLKKLHIPLSQYVK